MIGTLRTNRRWPVVRVGTGETGLHASRPTRPCRAPPPSIRGLIGSFRRVLMHADLLPKRSDLRGPAGRENSVPPRFPSDGAHGVLPFAVFIPLTGGSTSLPTRAHVSFVPVRPPRLIFVGVTGPPFGYVSRSKKGGSTVGQSALRLLGFIPVCGPHHRPSDAAILPWALPLAGFAGTYLCNQSGSTPIGSPASGEIVRFVRLSIRANRHPQSAHGFAAAFPNRTCKRGEQSRQ